MLPQLALWTGVCFVVWLFWRDMKVRSAGSPALLIPAIYLAILGSRNLSYWFGIGVISRVEGSPFDRFVFLLLMLAGVLVLLKRRVAWVGVVSRNKAMFFILLYLLVSTLWSYYPDVSFKRWTKLLSCVLMVLVILTERSPVDAIRIVYVRCAYVLFPLSVVTAKYFPGVGMVTTRSWYNMITGLTEHKNMLGQVVMVFGLMVVWDILETHKRETAAGRRVLLLNHVSTLLCGLWLLVKCNSQTAVVCVALGAFILWGSGRLLQMRRPKQTLIACFVAVFCLVGLELVFNLSDSLFEVLGRDKSLTGRTEIWQAVREQQVNPVIGCGFYGFWDRPHTAGSLDEYIGSGFITAHNGYLEMYLDGGMIGVGLLAVMLMTGILRVIKRLLGGTVWGRVAFMFVIIQLVYNCSETDFFRHESLWLTYLLVFIEYPRRVPRVLPRTKTQAKTVKPLVRDLEFDLPTEIRPVMG